jgi:xanthine dehydrogenase accessory factor
MQRPFVTLMETDATVFRSPPGGVRAVLEASATVLVHGETAALAIVVATEGSTYVRPGAMALFGHETHAGWLSGGCLEPGIAGHARQAAEQARLEWLDIDTRDDEDLLSGSALGCRGRLRIALLPLQALRGWDALVADWMQAPSALRLQIAGDGAVIASTSRQQARWNLAVAERPPLKWQLEIPPPPSVLVFGAGPETPTLLPLLRTLGWITTLVERRPRWKPMAAFADAIVETTPETTLSTMSTLPFDAALVMHHNFELDREALAALSSCDIGFVGLLGPTRRRDDLFRVLASDVRDALASRLRSPVGMDLGGHGPEAIALSIAAQLHAFRHSP